MKNPDALLHPFWNHENVSLSVFYGQTLTLQSVRQNEKRRFNNPFVYLRSVLYLPEKLHQ